MHFVLRTAALLMVLVSVANVHAASCDRDLAPDESSFSYVTGTRKDEFVHLEIGDEAWARTVLPKVAFAPHVPGQWRKLIITRGNTPIPEIMVGDEYVTYFDHLEFERIEGSRDSGSIVYHLNSGISFELRFEAGLRRKVEMWVHGLSGPVRSKIIFTARSGLEVFG